MQQSAAAAVPTVTHIRTKHRSVHVYGYHAIQQTLKYGRRNVPMQYEIE